MLDSVKFIPIIHPSNLPLHSVNKLHSIHKMAIKFKCKAANRKQKKNRREKKRVRLPTISRNDMRTRGKRKGGGKQQSNIISITVGLPLVPHDTIYRLQTYLETLAKLWCVVAPLLLPSWNRLHNTPPYGSSTNVSRGLVDRHKTQCSDQVGVIIESVAKISRNRDLALVILLCCMIVVLFCCY